MVRWTSRTLTLTLTAAVLLTCVASARAGTVTFSADVAPLLYEHCATCHRPGGPSSTVLLSYAQARSHARQIVQMTQSGQMPPWQPAGAHGVFAGDRRLSPAQVAVFQRWLDDGLEEGDPARLPPAPTFTDGWQLGTPDLVLTMPAYTLRADGPDMFRNFVLPVPIPALRYVQAVEFQPGNARVVHHARVLIDETGTSRRQDAEEIGRANV